MCGSCAEKKIAATGLQRKKFAAAGLQGKKNCSSRFFLQQNRGGQIIYFWGIFLQKGFLIQIRFRGQFSGEIFINLS